MTPALLLAYPLLVHLAVVWRQPHLEWLALVLLCAIPQYPALRAARPGHWLLLLGLAGLLYGLTAAGGGIYALFLPPVVAPLMLLALFAGSLRAPQIPLVTRLAQAARGPLEPELLLYTRRLTQMWALILAAIAAVNAGLAWFAPLPVWSLFSNFLNYLLVALVLCVEFLYRRWRFPSHAHQGFLAYLRLVASTNYRTA